MQAVGGNWSCLASRMLLTAFNTEILSILEPYWYYQNLLTYNQLLMLLLLRLSIRTSQIYILSYSQF